MTIAVPTSGGWTFDAQLEDEHGVLILLRKVLGMPRADAVQARSSRASLRAGPAVVHHAPEDGTTGRGTLLHVLSTNQRHCDGQVAPGAHGPWDTGE